MLRMTSVRSQRASSISAPHDLRADSEVGRHSLPRTTSVRTRRSGVIFRLARPLCKLGGRASFSASHDLCANSEVGRHFSPRTTSVRRLIDLGSPSSIRTIFVRRPLDLGSPSPIRTTSVRRSLDLGPPSPIRTTSVCLSDSHDLGPSFARPWSASLDLGPSLRFARP